MATIVRDPYGRQTLHLTPAEIAAAARRAYDGRALQAQTATMVSQDVECLYNGPCAIGAAMPEAFRRNNFDQIEGMGLSGLIAKQTVFVEDWDDWSTRSALEDLQHQHDMWVRRGEEFEPFFVEALERLEDVVRRRIGGPAADQA